MDDEDRVVWHSGRPSEDEVATTASSSHGPLGPLWPSVAEKASMFTTAGWTNPWERIQATTSLEPKYRHLEGPTLSDRTKLYAATDATHEDDSTATRILEAKVNAEMAYQYTLLAYILAVDGRQKNKSYAAILQARVDRYKYRLTRYRWEKLFKATNDVEGSRAVYMDEIKDETASSNNRRTLYRTVVQWLEKHDEVFRNMKKGWAKCRYVTERVFQEVVLFTAELCEERMELERVYREKAGKPPAFHQGNWTGPLRESD
ncbi:uncharacterized protein AB675_7117 [Cyphellophora attinorum]|uniref:Uncharacterized protein n=1 Tax=Cyphellophora attinorum TaxID=1664694 RepID=A0A0N0NPZ7_9EURO|nr:uncharacterized protein AB675_7117 [Phialophora attinorum]KPI43341.1 hypothetical protein AB675_7117 [Phialophora attinorum]